MQRSLLGMAAVLVASVSLFAQTPTTGARTAAGGTQAAAGAAADPSHVVMSGCIERADQLVPAGSNPIGTTVDSLDFVLTHAQVADSPHPTEPAPTATSGTSMPGQNGIGSMYRLDGRTETINPHVGHHVEITGTRAPSGSGAKPPSANAVNPSAANAPIIKVESIKLLGETCAR